ncbi:hypothetical protein FHQ18_06580 [Deferribacter autotrophicus]|uniref:Uncharacterized protein n=1 Tax=Deferribacter autotrophicus TaxID=500465 RepID=A0A5A8F7F0_9BACT|nr:hypothetical protein [Deferribacter autotrophicus]KAA0258057.1 hypothetical protein FHQ18_06580 [Deferribacter autotrophicus]
MVKKKNQVLDEVPIDKVESFVEKNFKNILIVVGVLILAVLAGYGVKTYMSNKYISSLNELGGYEISFANGEKDKALISDYVDKGVSISKVKDYVVLKAIQLYTDLGLTNEIKMLASNVGDNFRELSDSLLSDLNIKNVDANKYLTDSYLKPVWYYKAILNSKSDDERKKLYEEFKLKFPESRLLELLDNWGLNS